MIILRFDFNYLKGINCYLISLQSSLTAFLKVTSMMNCFKKFLIFIYWLTLQNNESGNE